MGRWGSFIHAMNTRGEHTLAKVVGRMCRGEGLAVPAEQWISEPWCGARLLVVLIGCLTDTFSARTTSTQASHDQPSASHPTSNVTVFYVSLCESS